MRRAECPACGQPLTARALLLAVTPLRIRCTACRARLVAGWFVFWQGALFATGSFAVLWWTLHPWAPWLVRMAVATLLVSAIAAVNVALTLRFARYRRAAGA